MTRASAAPRHWLTRCVVVPAVAQVIKSKASYVSQARAEIEILEKVKRASQAAAANGDGTGASPTVAVMDGAEVESAHDTAAKAAQRGASCIVEMLEHFTHKGHPCIVFEVLSLNLCVVVPMCQGGRALLASADRPLRHRARAGMRL